jgi:uncharacterized RmlC-like cupin family protein
VSGADGVRVVRGGEVADSPRKLAYGRGISAETVGATGICMHLGVVPPGGVAEPHLHEHHETALYVVSGRAGTDYGPDLEHYVESVAGDFVYIAAGVPHRPRNLSETEPAVYIVARTDPNEEESVVLLPHLAEPS